MHPPTAAPSKTSPTCPVDVWVSFVVRDQQLLTVRADTTLHAGDDLLILADDRDRLELTAIFETSGSELPPGEPT